MSELHRGDPLQVSIETATIDGSGVARVDGQVVFVPGTLPGEGCSVRIAHVGRSAVFAQLLSVLTPSVHRVEPDCPYFPSAAAVPCGIWTTSRSLHSSRRTSRAA